MRPRLQRLYDKANAAFQEGKIQLACQFIRQAVLQCTNDDLEMPQLFRKLASQVVNHDAMLISARKT